MILKSIRILILTMLLVSMALVPVVSAQETLKLNDEPSELEQGLIDALNSNTKGLPKDIVIANYCKANKDKISIPENDTVSAKII